MGYHARRLTVALRCIVHTEQRCILDHALEWIVRRTILLLVEARVQVSVMATGV